MGGGFNRREPTDTTRIHHHPHVRDIFLNHQWMGFFDKLKGYDEEVTHAFSMVIHSQGEESATNVVRGLGIHLKSKLITRVTTIPLGF